MYLAFLLVWEISYIVYFLTLMNLFNMLRIEVRETSLNFIGEPKLLSQAVHSCHASISEETDGVKQLILARMKLKGLWKCIKNETPMDMLRGMMGQTVT